MKKKSLIESLKSTRKANIVTAPAKNEGSTSRKAPTRRAALNRSGKMVR